MLTFNTLAVWSKLMLRAALADDLGHHSVLVARCDRDMRAFASGIHRELDIEPFTCTLLWRTMVRQHVIGDIRAILPGVIVSSMTVTTTRTSFSVHLGAGCKAVAAKERRSEGVVAGGDGHRGPRRTPQNSCHPCTRRRQSINNSWCSQMRTHIRRPLQAYEQMHTSLLNAANEQSS